MAIRVAQRAEVTEEFRQGMVEAARLRMRNIKAGIEFMTETRQRSILKNQAGRISKLKLMATDKEEMDRQITKLRSLPFEKFEMITHRNQLWFRGTTKNIIIIEGSSKWDIGPYAICIKLQSLETAQANPQMIPLWEPRVWKRHPHHNAYPQGGQDLYNYDWRRYTGSPLDLEPRICWGTFGGIITGVFGDADIPEIYRALHTYNERYNPHSPLNGNIEYVEHRKELR